MWNLFEGLIFCFALHYVNQSSIPGWPLDRVRHLVEQIQCPFTILRGAIWVKTLLDNGIYKICIIIYYRSRCITQHGSTVSVQQTNPLPENASWSIFQKSISHYISDDLSMYYILPIYLLTILYVLNWPGGILLIRMYKSGYKVYVYPDFYTSHFQVRFLP